jgi:hypothetical protein
MIAKFLIAVFVVLGLIHLYWAAGGRIGHSAAIPQVGNKPSFQPGAIATIAVAFALFGAACVVALRSGVLPDPALAFLAMIGCWALAAILALRAIGDFRLVGFFKRVTGTRFARADSLFYSPLCAVLAALVAVVARG